MVTHYKELIAWQRAMDLVEAVYRLSSEFPQDERFGLTSQLRRCAVSVPSNIAEGQGRGSTVDFVRFLRIANGSRQEVETQLLIAIRLGYLSDEDCNSCFKLSEELGRILSGLFRSLTNH